MTLDWTRFRSSVIGCLYCFMSAVTAAAGPEAAHYLLQAERAHLTGASQASGSDVWTYGGSATWDVVTSQGRYRLFMRVRAGYAGDHRLGVKKQTLYSATIDGRPLSFAEVDGSLVYGSDESNWAWVVADVGALSRGAHQIIFKASWQFGRWDAFVLTANPKYAPPRNPPFGPETKNDLSLLNEQDMRWFQGYSLWTSQVEENCSPTSRPTKTQSIESHSLTVLRDQHGAAALNVTNWLAEPCSYRIAEAGELNPFPQTAVPLPFSAYNLRQAIPLPAPRKEQLADALPRLGEAGLLLVPRKQTRQIWVEIDARKLTPEKYTVVFQVQPLSGPGRCESHFVQLTVQIVDVALPGQHPLGIFLCEYDVHRRGMSDDLTSHYVNWFHNCLTPHPAQDKPDYTAMDLAVRREWSLQGARSVFFEHWHFRQSQDWKKPKVKTAWVRGIRRWAQHVRNELKLDYDQFSLHIFDEVSGGGIDTFLAARAVVREADPKVRVTMTLTPGISADEIEKLNPAVDIWCPHMELLENKPKVVQQLQATNKPILPYYCAENKRFWPAQHYRLWSWRLYRDDMDGLFMWTYLSRDAWKGRSWDGGMVFAGNSHIVPSRRWELMRMGLQDWLLLDKACRTGHGQIVEQLVEQVLDQADDPAVLRQARQKLISLLRKRK